MTNLKYIVTKENEGLPLKKVLRNHFDFSSRFLSKIKYQNLVTVNGKITPLWFEVNEGDIIIVTKPAETSAFPPENIPIYPVFEDEQILVINKQPGIIVHPTKGHPIHTIANALMYYMTTSNQNFKIRFVNRLDMDTSGLLVIAKNAYIQNQLTKQMQKRQMKKVYQALVKGIIQETCGEIDLPIGRPDEEKVTRSVLPIEKGGYPSLTKYTVLDRYNVIQNKTGEAIGYTLVQLNLGTGRTHQIRVHMSYIGHPVVGDHLYGGTCPSLIDRQALHACHLEFIHPINNKKISLDAPMPKDIANAIDKIK